MFKNLSQTKKYLLIVPNENKNKTIEFLMSFNKLLNIKVMSLNEIKNRLFFEPTNETFTTIHYNYNKPLSIINTLIDYLYYVDLNSTYNNNKLDELREIKSYLFTNNLVKLDHRFIHILKQYKVIFYDFVIINKEVNFVVNEIKKYTDVEIYDNYKNHYSPSLTELPTLEEEINYVCYSISKLLEQNIDINNIKLCNVNDDYTFYLKRIFKNYNIPLNLKEKISLYSLPLSNEFIELLSSTSKEDTISILKNKYPNYLDYINMYINILNKYTHLKNLDINLIVHELKNTNIKQTKKTNSIEIININEIGNSNYHIFIMSCNYNYFPSINKDEDYLLDIEKDLINISTSKEINKNNMDSIIKLIHSSKNIYLSYKKNSYFNEYHPVDFLTDIIKTTFIKDIKESYSKNEDIITLTKLYDSNNTNDKFYILNNSITLNYKSYDHSFTPIDEVFYSNLKPSISYSSLTLFNECPFKYYMSKILKLDEFESSIHTIIGNIMHEVIENSFNDDFDFETQFKNSLLKNTKDVELTNAELFFLKNIKERTLQVVNFLKDKEHLTKLINKEHEREISFDKNINGHTVNINGKIDKIIYTTINNVLYTALIDFKTGKDVIDPKLFDLGFSLQLPFYTYLIKNEEVKDTNKIYFNDSTILGLYIHNILNKENDDINLKYNGYSLNNKDLISILDSSYENSKLIRSLKITTKGDFDSKSKLFTEEQINNFPSLIEEYINNMVNSIFNGDFKIKPKKLNNKDDLSCEYCKYFAVCYKEEKDYQYLQIKKPIKKESNKKGGK